MSFEVAKGAQVAMRLRAMADRAEDLRPAWPGVAEEFGDQMAQQFATEGAHFGRPWKPLDPEYVSWKVSNGYQPQILVASGQMRRTFTSPTVFEADRDHILVGSSSRIAKYHQHGTSRGLPARPILVGARVLRRAVTRRLRAWVVDGRTR